MGGAGASHTAHVVARRLIGAWHTLQCGYSVPFPLPCELGPGGDGCVKAYPSGRS